MKVIVKRAFAGPTHGSWSTKKGAIQEMPEETAKMALKAGFAIKAPATRRKTAKALKAKK
jgi:hypothetical protein